MKLIVGICLGAAIMVTAMSAYDRYYHGCTTFFGLHACGVIEKPKLS